MKRILLLSISFLFVLGTAWAQRTVSGRVTSDSDGGGIPGVNVILKGTTTGTTSDLDGNYRVSVPEEGGTLVFSFIGLATQEVEIGARSVVDVSMSEDVETLSEVVVTALGFSREKKALGYGVTTISNSSIENRPEADIGRILRGKAPGVDIAQTSGMAGTGTNIIVRGYSSISGTNQPLFVIDGVPFNTDTNSDQSFVQGGATASSRFLDLDPNNIAEISILKGLSATVLYGEAGRNGVILVTTKTGRGGAGAQTTDVRFSQQLNWVQVANLPDYQDTFGNGFSGDFGWFFSNWGPSFDTQDSNGVGPTANGAGYGPGQIPHPLDQAQYNEDFPEFIGVPYDYRPYKSVENFFQTGLRSNTSVGFDKALGTGSSVSFNYSYLDDAGFIPEDKNRFKKHNFSLGGQTELSNGIKINSSFNYVDSDLVRPPAAVGAGSNPSGASLFANLIYTPRSIDLLNLPYQSPVDGSNAYYRRGAAIQNPLWTLNNAGDVETVRRYFGNVQMSYSITDWLLFTYRVGLDQYTQNTSRRINKGGPQVPNGQMITTTRLNTINDQVFNFAVNRNITEDISFDALVGLNVRRETRDQTYMISSQQFVFGLFNHGNFVTHQNFSLIREENTIGAYATASFGYRDFVYVNFQGRNDWTSTLESDNRSIFYPSASVSFVPTDAIPALSSNNVLDFLKIRVGYGTSAGYPTPYQTRNVLGSQTNAFLNSAGIALNTNTVSDQLANPDLKPEVHSEAELGIEARLLDNRIGLDVSLYDKNSSDLIIARQLDASTGFLQTTVNAAEVYNRGIEAGLNLTPVRGAVTWNVGLNLTRNVNKVESIAPGVDQLAIPSTDPITGQVGPLTFDGVNNWIIPGEWYGVMQGSAFEKDPDGNIIVSPAGSYLVDNTTQIIGNPNPNYTANMTSTLSWKGISLYMQWQYVDGGDIYSITAATMLARGNTSDTDVDRFIPIILPGVNEVSEGVYQPNNVQVYLGDASFDGFFGANEGSIFDGTVIRMREISLSYALPASLLENTPFGTVDFVFTGQNLFYNAPNFPEGVNYDPDVLSTGVGNNRGLEFVTGPTTKNLGVGLNLTF